MNSAYLNYTEITWISSYTGNFKFLDQIYPKRVFPVQSRTNERLHRIQHICISLGNKKFHLKQIILSIWTKFAQKGYLWSRTGQMNITTEFSILELVQVPAFILSRPFEIFWTKFVQKGCFPSKAGQIKTNYHRIQHIWISLDAKFHLKQRILICLIKLTQKW